MFDVSFKNSVSGCVTWTFTDSTDYSGFTLASITLRIWVPGADPDVATADLEHAVPIGAPNTPIEFDPTDFGLDADAKLPDGIYTIRLIVTSNEPDSPQTTLGYYLGTCNVRACILDKLDDAFSKHCDCKDKDFEFIAKMNAILNGMCMNYDRQRYDKVKADLLTLQNMCKDDSDCHC